MSTWTSADISSTCFKVAALLNLVSAPFHEKLGYDSVKHVLGSIEESPENAVGKHGPWFLWHYVGAAFAICAFLNMQWSQSAPKSIYEKLVFWTVAGISYTTGFRYFKIGVYPPLTPLWFATTFQVAGWAFS